MCDLFCNLRDQNRLNQHRRGAFFFGWCDSNGVHVFLTCSKKKQHVRFVLVNSPNPANTSSYALVFPFFLQMRTPKGTPQVFICHHINIWILGLLFAFFQCYYALPFNCAANGWIHKAADGSDCLLIEATVKTVPGPPPPTPYAPKPLPAGFKSQGAPP